MEQQNVPVDSIEVAPYKIGYSFRNPPAVWPVTETRKQFFRMRWLAEGPTEKKEAMWKSGNLKRYPTVWRRAHKMSPVDGLSGVEMPDFHELGQALAPTTTKDNVERSFWGTLTNKIVDATSTVFNEQQKLQIAKMQPQYPQSGFMPMLYSQQQGIGALGWGMIILGGGALAFVLLKR